jgi:hypothetical protein
MNTYKRHRFPPAIISYAVWLYFRFNLSDRDIEDLLAERGITVSCEAIRLWCIKFGTIYPRRLKRKHRGYGDNSYIDEVFAGVPDHSDQRQAALFMAGRRSGEPAPRSALGMAMSLMYIYSRSATWQLQNLSSNACYEAIAANTERS